MRRVRSLDTDPDRDEKPAAEGRRMLRWYVRPRSADDDGSPSALEVQHLAPHCNQVGRLAAAFGKALDLGDLVRVLELAGRWHDAGKNRAVWQRYIGNPGYDPLKPETAWAKSAGGVGKLAESYRHEFGSLLDVETEPDFGVLSEGDKDVLLHLIAAHHGRARPHFPDGEDFDPGPRGRDVSGIVRDVPRRFVRLQRRFGRWGLAYIESLLRAADAFASRRPEGGSRD
jgi:CRISPR-associated endonuclease/helicase Cas3